MYSRAASTIFSIFFACTYEACAAGGKVLDGVCAATIDSQAVAANIAITATETAREAAMPPAPDTVIVQAAEKFAENHRRLRELAHKGSERLHPSADSTRIVGVTQDASSATGMTDGGADIRVCHRIVHEQASRAAEAEPDTDYLRMRYSTGYVSRMDFSRAIVTGRCPKDINDCHGCAKEMMGITRGKLAPMIAAIAKTRLNKLGVLANC